MPVYVERSVLGLARIYINGGRRGYLVGIAPAVLSEVLGAVAVDCALRSEHVDALDGCGDSRRLPVGVRLVCSNRKSRTRAC